MSEGDGSAEEVLREQMAQASCSSSSSTETSPQQEEKKPVKFFPIFGKNFRPKENVPLVGGGGGVRKKMKLSTKLTKDPEGVMQMILDAGQKNIGPVLCGDCGLLFSPGDFQDEEEHRKAHVRIENTFKLTLWKDAKILFNYEDGCQILMVQCDTEPSKVKKLRDFLAWLDSELGAGYNPSGLSKSERIFLYTSRTKRKNVVRILGCGIMELPDPTRIIVEPLVMASSQASNSSLSGADETEGVAITKRKVFIGITRLWTDIGFRKRSIATRLCEMMRFNSGLLGCIVQKENIGILEPSDSGRAFLIKYAGSKGSSYTYCH